MLRQILWDECLRVKRILTGVVIFDPKKTGDVINQRPIKSCTYIFNVTAIQHDK